MAKTTLKDLQNWKSSQKFSGRTTRQGKKFNAGTAALLDAANVILQNSPHYGKEKGDMTIVQGSYSGGVAASAGTHNGGAAVDLTAFNWINRSWVLRILGATGSRRPAIRNVWSDHIHSITCGDGTASAGAARQVTSYYNGRNGLANNGRDADKRPAALPILFVAPWDSRGKPGVYYLTKAQTMRTSPSVNGKARGSVKKNAKFTVAAVVNVKGTLWAINIHGNCVPKSSLTTKKPTPKPTPAPKRKSLRVATLNFPDAKEKIKGVSEEARIARAHTLLKTKDLDVIALQELVGWVGTRKASALATKFAQAFGSDWTLVVPTTAWNENYYLVNTKNNTLKKQYPDAVIRGTVGQSNLPGKHVTLINVEHDIGSVDIGNAHYVENWPEGAEVHAKLAAQALSSLRDNQARILMGDFNTNGPLAAMKASGLSNARTKASASTNKTMPTYHNYALTKPSTNAKWIIDGIWASKHLVPSGYTVMPDLAANGNFNTPRPSDHLPVVAAFRPL